MRRPEYKGTIWGPAFIRTWIQLQLCHIQHLFCNIRRSPASLPWFLQTETCNIARILQLPKENDQNLLPSSGNVSIKTKVSKSGNILPGNMRFVLSLEAALFLISRCLWKADLSICACMLERGYSRLGFLKRFRSNLVNLITYPFNVHSTPRDAPSFRNLYSF